MPLGPADVVADPAEAMAEPIAPIAPAVRDHAPDQRRGAALSYWVVVASHLILDLYPIFIFALAASLQANLHLSEKAIAIVLAINPIISGVCQPLFAWLGDKWNTRIFGPLGILAACLCLSSIGFATTLWELIALQVIGVAGVGVYHPISAAVAGRLGEDAFAKVKWTRSPRGLGLSVFFTAGMLGGFLGPIISSRINAHEALGMRWLAVMIVPGLIAAALLWWCTRHVQHLASRRPRGAPNTDAFESEFSPFQRWAAVALLFTSNSMRFTVNLGLYYLYKQWAQARFAGEGAAYASSRASDLLSATTLGMALFGMLVGTLTRPGREKWPTALTAFAAVPVLLLMPHVGYYPMLVLAFFTSIGHFSAIPISIAVAQRLLPHATGSVGSILLGCGWVISAAGPLVCGWIVIQPGMGLAHGFWFLAACMGVAGVCGVLLPDRLLRASTRA